MKVTAITKFKQGDLYASLKKLGWTQAELAKRAGVSKNAVATAINLRNKPLPSNLDRIQKALAKAGEFLDVMTIWPEDFKGFKKSVTVEQTKEVDVALLARNTPTLHDTMKPNLDDARRLIEQALSTIPEREARIISQKHFEGKSLPEIAKQDGISTQAIVTVYNRGLRRMRHPTRIRPLQEAKDCVT